MRTCITDTTGTYEFTGLSTNIDHDLRARAKDGAKAEEQLTRFDTRKDAVVNLQAQPSG